MHGMRHANPMKPSALFKRWTVLLLVVAALFFAILPRFIGRNAEDLNSAADTEVELPNVDKLLPEEDKSNPDFAISGKATAKDRTVIIGKPGGLFGSSDKVN